MLTSSTILFNSHSTRRDRAGGERRQGGKGSQGGSSKGISRGQRRRSRRVIWGKGFRGAGEVSGSLCSGKPEIFGVRDEQPTKWQKSGLKS